MNHSPLARFDDGVLGDAAAIYAALAATRLQGPSQPSATESETEA